MTEAEKKLDIIFDSGETSCATFVLFDEDHTLGNILRYMLVKNPKVEFAGYSLPHPSEKKLNLRVQTTKELNVPATTALREVIDNLEGLGKHILAEFNSAVEEFEKEGMDTSKD